MSLRREGTVADPLRVVVAGNSAAYMVVPGGEARGAGNYGEQLAVQLGQAGLVTEVRHSTQWYGMIDSCRRDFERLVRNHFPDVLVVHYGMAECQPRVVPTTVVRHIMGWNRSGAWVSVVWHEALARAWPRFRRLQTSTARRTGLLTWRMPPDRFRREVATVVRLARTECAALVLLVDIDPPGPRIRALLPGMEERHARFQRELASLVADLDAELGKVRLVPASEDIPGGDDELLLADGLHRTSAGHALLAERIARIVVAEATDPSRPA